MSIDIEETDPLWLAYVRVSDWELAWQDWSNINAWGIRASGEYGFVKQ